MKLSPKTYSWLKEDVQKIISDKIVEGLENALNEFAEVDDLESVDCCQVWIAMIRNGHTQKVIESLNNDSGDMFGNEGWEEDFGLND